MSFDLHIKSVCLRGMNADAGLTASLWYVGVIMPRHDRVWESGTQ
jgi:hypothetical protein